MAQGSSFPPNQTAYLPLGGAGLPRQGGSRAIAADIHQPESATGRLPRGHFVRAAPDMQQAPANGRSAMRSKDLMSPDLLSEIALLGFGMLILASLLLFLVTALTRP